MVLVIIIVIALAAAITTTIFASKAYEKRKAAKLEAKHRAAIQTVLEHTASTFEEIARLKR